MLGLRTCLLVCLLFSFTEIAAANDVLERIPENALGFGVVRNLEETNAKVEQLLEHLDVNFSAPLAIIRQLTGLNSGIDLNGDLVVALLPGASADSGPEPMVFLPVTSYEEFSDSLNGDASGEICRVTLLGEDVLIAQDGSYALMMNVEHRETMEELVVLAAEPVTALTPLASWILEQEIALVLMPEGIDSLSQWKLRSTRTFQLGMEISPASRLFYGLMEQGNRDWLRRHVDLAAVGVTVDPQANLHISQQVVFRNSSPLAQVVPELEKRQASRFGFSDKSFVLTAGGPWAPDWGEQLATFLRNLEQSQAAANGLSNVTPELWERNEQAYHLLFDDIEHCSVVMLPGKKGEPLVGNFVGVATVPDTSKYLDSLPEVVTTWNEITKLSTSDIKPKIEIHQQQIAGKPGYEFVVDVAAAAEDPRVPALNWMFEAAFGPSGKMRTMVAPVDEKTFVFGLSTPEQLAEYLNFVQHPVAQADQTIDMQATLGLLNDSERWKLLISPSDLVDWTARIVNELMSPLTDREVPFPRMQNCPPLGLTVEQRGRNWGIEIVCPAKTWQALGAYQAALGTW